MARYSDALVGWERRREVTILWENADLHVALVLFASSIFPRVCLGQAPPTINR